MSYKRWLFVAIFLFGIGFSGGLTLGQTTPDATAGLFSEDVAAFEEFVDLLASLPQSSVFLLILLKNTSAILISFALSPIFCLTPVVALILNGGILGFVSVLVVQQKSLGFLLAGLLPHGIFELPALIMGEAAALSFGAMVIMLLVRKESRTVLLSIAKQSSRHILLTLALFFITGIFPTIVVLALLREQTRAIFMTNLRQNLRYLMIALILLLPAAIIETYITPLLLR